MEDGRRWETNIDWEIGFPLSVPESVPWMFRCVLTILRSCRLTDRTR